MADALEDDFRSKILRVRGNVARFIGADVDKAVLENPLIDEAVVFDPSEALPFDEGQFDLVLSDWVLEHIADPTAFAAEVHRILKPRGWFCARTPNKWGYFAVGTRLLPSRAEGTVLSKLQPARKEVDVFPKFYRMNTERAIRNAFRQDLWKTYLYYSSPSPAYHGGSRILFSLIDSYQRLAPDIMKSVLLMFIQKSGPEGQVLHSSTLHPQGR
jgi:SAM-dependent methyltransferase